MELYHYIQKIRERKSEEASTEVKADPLEGTPVSVSTENALEVEQQPEQVSGPGKEYEAEKSSPPVWQSRAMLSVCALLVLFTAAYAMYYWRDLWTDLFLKPKFSESRNPERTTKKIHLIKNNAINSHPAPLLDQAKMFLAAKDYNKAVSVLKKYLQHNNDPDALNDYGAVLLLADRCNEAVSYFQKALSQKEDPEIRLNLAAALICAGKPLQALKEFESVTEKDLSSSSARILAKQLEEFFLL